MSTIAVVGSMNADLTVRTARLPRPGETVAGSELEINPGGKSANQAAVAARLGADVRLLGLVGDDPNGELLRTAAEEAGVDTGFVGVVEGVATGTAMIAVDDEAENFIIISPGANGHLDTDRFAASAAVLENAAVLCLCLEIDLQAVTAAAEQARRAGTTVVLNLSPSQPVPAELLAATDVLLVNEHELTDLVGEFSGDWGDAHRRLRELGVGSAVVTLGARGAVVLGDAECCEVPSLKVSAVDTTGAGDAFTGSLALRLAEGDDLVTATRFAVQVAACSTTVTGAQRSYPTTAQLEAFLAERSGPSTSQG